MICIDCVPVPQADAIIYKRTVMIEICDASIADSTMFSPKGSETSTAVT